MSDSQLELAIEAAQAAGQLLRDGFAAEKQILSEQGKDIKARADRDAEACILAKLAPSGLPVLTEESGLIGEAAGARWIIDPLDGTLNYTRGIPLCCVSIALWQDRTPVLGVIYEFLHDRMFCGVVGEGAWCNRQSIRASSVAEPARAVIATGFPSSSDFGDQALLTFVQRVQRFKKVRLIGSAALSLAQVATGAMDAYAENGIHFWDVAAGLALVEAAGGKYSLGPYDARWRCDVAATNGRLPPSSLST